MRQVVFIVVASALTLADRPVRTQGPESSLGVPATSGVAVPFPGGQVGGAVPGTRTPGVPPRDAVARPTGTARIRGRVVAAGAATPLRRAQVTVTLADGPYRHTTTTDAEGRYEVKELPAGRYLILVSKGGYVGLQYGQRRPFEPGTLVAVGDGETRTSVDVALSRGSVIAGRITDEFGEPVSQVQVVAQRQQYGPDGQRRLVPAGNFAATDDLGQFRLYSLTPGEYLVSAVYRSVPGIVIGSFGGDTSEGFAPTFYPGTINVNDAQAISVGLGQESSIQFALNPARMARVSGVVADSAGRAVTGAMVTLLPANGMPLPGAMTGSQSGTDGAFSVSNVSPGDYIATVQVIPGLSGRAGEGESGSLRVSVGGSDLSGVRITTGRGTRVSGQVEFVGTAPRTGGPQPLRVMVQSSVVGRMTFAFSAGSANGLVADDGSFELEVSGGEDVLFRPTTTAPWALKAVLLDGQDITDTPIDVGATSVSDLRVVLTDRRTTVTGRVTDGRGQPTVDYAVILLPSEPKEGPAAARYLRLARPDQNGQYSVTGLPPGRYVATAVEYLEQGRQFVPEVQERLRERGKEVSLREGETVSLDLRMATAVE